MRTPVIELLEYENLYKSKGYNLIAGVDEVGRGPLAGPVVTACVIMNLDELVDGVDDSKKLSEKKREQLFNEIISHAVAYKITFTDEKAIDEINILEATKKSMAESITGLEVKPDIVLIDAVKLENISVEQCPIIKGDAKSYSIACASILAKVARDRYMVEMDGKYPAYNFKKHKGYGTKEHIEALKKVGPCILHRKTFIKNFIGEVNG